MSGGDFDVQGLASYLHLTPQQILRLADRGKLPGRKVSGQWRFPLAEIHHWLEERIGLSDEDELVGVEDVLQRADQRSGKAAPQIASLLPLQAIAIPLIARTRNSVIDKMVQLAAGTGLLWDADKLAEAVRNRENLHPTALDNGVAMLHPRRPMASILQEPFLALGRTLQGIPFGGSGGALTDLFFLICSVEDRGHLRTLARLSRLVADASFLNTLRQLDDAAAVQRFIAEAEAGLGD
jgi:PTS system nitrogen regulatory IIA component